ncbi:MAG TPA: cation:proton antiporter [Candidatus Nitrosotalea sp.]|nr:cation:proton antiporter [Candidatus Nitrosotalea sp.]
MLFNILPLIFALGNSTYSEKIQQILDSNFLRNNISSLNHYLVNSVFHGISLASAEIVLLAVGVIIFIGVGGEAFFRKTGIPDVTFLMVFGVIVGPILGIVNSAVVLKIVPYFSALALIIIMFDGGLNLDIKSIIKTAHFATLLAVLGFAVSTISAAVIAVYGLGWHWADGLLLGIMVGGSSSIVVFGLVRRLSISDETKAMLSLESAITDILATIGAFLLFSQIASHNFDPSLIVTTAFRSIGVGLLLGFGVGLPWMYLSSRLLNAKHSYMLTLGILFVLFFLAKSLGESGALTALIFGLMLGNKQVLGRRLRFKMPEVSTDNSFHEQITFIVRSFFFVFIGLLANFGQFGFIVFGIAMAIVFYIGRYGISKAILTKRFTAFDRKVTSVMLPRGLAAAVLATIPLTLGLPNASAYPQIIFVVIISTVVITTIGLGGAKKLQPSDPPASNI